MSKTFPAAVIARQAASGGSAPVSLLEVQSVSGSRYYWSDATLLAPSILSAYADSQGVAPISNPVMPANTTVFTPSLVYSIEQFVPWILTPPSFHSYKSIQTTTGSVEIQNVSGDTIYRDAAKIFTKQEMMGALVIFRQWMVDAEFATDTFQGNVRGVDVDADGESMTLSLEGTWNLSKIKAPRGQIGVSCGLTFKSVACGAVAGTPCNNDYGTCLSPNRFEGIVLEWTGATLNYDQYVQPEPPRLYNAKVAG